MSENNKNNTERFDKDLRDAFDLYAKERLDAISAASQNDRFVRVREKNNYRRRVDRALSVIMLTACLFALGIAVFMFARSAETPDKPIKPPFDNEFVADVSSLIRPKVTDTPITTAPTTTAPTTIESPITTGEFIYNYFFSSSSGSGVNSGSSGEFADPECVKLLPTFDLRLDRVSRSMIAYSNGEGYYGNVYLYLSAETAQIPAAVSYSFDKADNYPDALAVEGIRADGKHDLLHYYICPDDREMLELSFYIGLADDGVLTSCKYDKICVKFVFSDLESDGDGTMPKFTLYRAEDNDGKIDYTNYLVRNGAVCDISSNMASVSIPSSFGGCATNTLLANSVNGEKLPNLCEITIPEGVSLIAAPTFSSLDKLTTVNLPSTLRSGFATSSELWNSSMETYRNEIFDSVDQNGDGQVGRPFCTLFVDCPAIEYVNIAGGNADFYSIDGKVYTKDNLLIFDPSDPAFSIVYGETIIKPYLLGNIK